MKKIYYIIAALIASAVQGAGLINPLEKQLLKTDQKIFLTAAEEKQKRLVELRKEREEFAQSDKQFLDKTNARLQELESRIEMVKQTAGSSEDEYLQKKLSILNENYQLIPNLQLVREHILELIDQQIELLEEYLKDIHLKSYRAEVKLVEKDVHSLQDLQRLSELIEDKEKSIGLLAEQEKNVDVELENRKRTVTAAEQAYKKKEDTRQQVPVVGLGAGIEMQKQESLAQLEEQLYQDVKWYGELRLKEIEYKRGVVRTRIFLQRLQLEVLKEELARVKPSLRVSEADVSRAKEELAKKKLKTFETIETYRSDIDALSTEQKEQEARLRELAQTNNIGLGTELNEWAKEPLATSAGYVKFLEVADLNDAVLLLQRKKDLIASQITLEEEKMRSESIHTDIIESFYKITTNKFVQEEETQQELRKYDAPKAETKANISLFKDRRDSAQEQLNKQKKALERLKSIRETIKTNKDSLFKDHNADYLRAVELLNSAESKIQSQVDVLGKIINSYGDVIAVQESIKKEISLILYELDLMTIWQRSKYAITWEGVQNSLPNIQTFTADVRTYLLSFDISALIQKIRTALYTPIILLSFLFYCLLIIGILLLIKLLLPYLSRLLMYVGFEYKGLRFISYLGVMLCGFINSSFYLIALWVLVLCLMQIYPLRDAYPYILFYLASIPYLLYIAHRFIKYLVYFNDKHDHALISAEFQRRFIAIFSTLLYATITIFFFRQAYILSSYYKTELPTLLLAINFIILQISLIFLIAKEHILTIIPAKKSGFWEWVRTKVDQYYYLLLMFFIAIIVMSNPFVGFGKLVLYVLLRLIYTITLIALISWINIILRRSLSHVFFTTEHEVARERFTYGKTLYGICMIAIFLISLLLGCIVAAKVWGWPESLVAINNWSDLMVLLKTPILLEETAKISTFSILQIIFFIFMGFLSSFIVDTFVLEKIFDVLVVDTGVQNTITSILRYIIVIIWFIIGFQSVGLGELVWWFIGALIVGIGWVVKDPIGDFVAYFIILVQRPLKIGDYIKIDNHVMGVVRKITPRSVVIRRKNSVTIVLPNSKIITKPVVNWNYQAGFIAFHDIHVQVGYKEDPDKVKALLLSVLDEHKFVLKSPNPIVRLDDFTENGYLFMVRGFLNANYTLDQWDIASDVRLAIVRRLRDHGITIAVPTRIVLGRSDLGKGAIDMISGSSVSGEDR